MIGNVIQPNGASSGGGETAIDIKSLLNVSASQVGTVTLLYAYRVGKVCYVSGIIGVPQTETDYSGKTIFTMNNSVAPLASARFLAFSTNDSKEAIAYVDSGGKNLRFTGDDRNKAISTALTFTIYWIIA